MHRFRIIIQGGLLIRGSITERHLETTRILNPGTVMTDCDYNCIIITQVTRKRINSVSGSFLEIRSEMDIKKLERGSHRHSPVLSALPDTF